ncbi:MAG: hypothetical protein ACREUU_05030, partial [Gammaproteobacteria bacterium]
DACPTFHRPFIAVPGCGADPPGPHFPVANLSRKAENSGTMNTPRLVLAVVAFLSCAAPLPAADKPSLDPRLEPLRPLLEKTWKGAFKSSTPEKPLVDVMHWERALNGKAVRILHSVNNGAYGGESLVTWDAAKQSVVYHYFTTAGFMTTGTMSFKDGKVNTHEVVKGKADGVTEVRGETELRADGTLAVKTEHLKHGEWSAGREVVYKEDPDVRVVFK